MKMEKMKNENGQQYDRATQEEKTANLRTKGRDILWFKSVDGLILAFMLPLLAMILIYIQRGIFPFGDKSFLRTDMYHQYAPFFSEFQHKLKNGEGLLYTWNIGMGINFSALYAYYLASPLNWFVAIVPKEYVLEFMTYMIVVKIALCGLSFAYYLSKHGRKANVGIAFFGTFYALSGYMAAYNWNIMWLDCIILFPLICLGLERLVFKKKGLLYAIMLGISILSNYYISIMICLFMVMYFVALCILKRKMSLLDFLLAGLRFAFYSLLAGGLSAIVLVPEVYALKYTASASVKFPEVFREYFSIISMLARHMPGVETEIGLEHWPNIYCGVAIFILVGLYILNKRINAKEKIVYFTMLLIMLASFSVDVLNYIWHGLHYPNSLPARQSFIYIFLILYICYRAFYNFKWSNTTDLGTASAFSVMFVLLAQHSVKEKHFHFAVFYVSLALLGLYAYLLYLYKSRKYNRNALVLLTAFVVLMESLVNTGITSVSTVSRSDYKNDNIAVQRLVENVPKIPFYRFEKVERKTKNDGAWMNFRSVSLFSSTARKSLSDFFRRVGIESSTNAYSITGSTPLVDMLFAVKYGIYTGEQNSPYLSLVSNIDNTYLYENPYTLPIGYVVGPGFEDAWDRSSENPADVQNQLAQIVDAPNVLIPENGELDEQEIYHFTTSQAGQYYLFVTNPGVEDVRVKTISTGLERSFSNVNRRYMLDIGYLEAGEEISVSNTNSKSMDVVAYRFEMVAFSKVYAQLNVSTWDVTLVSDNYIEGTVEAGSDYQGQEVLMTSIPYDKGWKVMVDGTRVEAKEGLGAFMAVELAPGVHRVSMEYIPEGLVYGAWISAAALGMILFVYLVGVITSFLRKKKRRDFEKRKSVVLIHENPSVSADADMTQPSENESKVSEVTQANTMSTFEGESESSDTTQISKDDPNEHPSDQVTDTKQEMQSEVVVAEAKTQPSVDELLRNMDEIEDLNVE